MSIPFTSRVREALLDGAGAPFFGFLFANDGSDVLEGFAVFNEAFGGVRTAVEEHVFDEHLELGFDLFVDFEHAGVDDAHV